MPWTYPDSADSYLQLIKAIDREKFAVHLDPVNWVVSPQILYNNGEMIKESFKKLGKYIKSCHAKDVSIIEGTDLPQLIEVLPGTGYLDYRVYLTELAKLDNIPLMIEHLKTAEEYKKAAEYIRRII
jgi:sugar phosphate isomerase/epimerase